MDNSGYKPRIDKHESTSPNCTLSVRSVLLVDTGILQEIGGQVELVSFLDGLWQIGRERYVC